MSTNSIEKKISSRKRTLYTIALIAVLSISMLMVLPSVSANDPPQTHPTFAYLALSPDPVGVGQNVYVIMWVSPNPPSAEGFGGDVWRDYTVTVTAPDGTTSVLGPYNSDATGSTFATFTPSQVGSYKFDFDYPGQVLSLNSPSGIPADVAALKIASQRFGVPDKTLLIGDTFTGSKASATLIVQTEQIVRIPSTPLPTTFWTRPIHGQNSAWAGMASNWLSAIPNRRLRQPLAGRSWTRQSPHTLDKSNRNRRNCRSKCGLAGLCNP